MTLLDPVREAFVQDYIVHGNASQAFRKAKPKAVNWKAETVHKRASEMLLSGEVQGRLKQMQLESAEKHEITIDKLTKMTLAAYEMAMKDHVKAPSAAVKASEFLGKLHGLVVEKKELTGANGTPLVPVANVFINRAPVKPSSTE